jgi:hypothetical protein
MISIDNQQMPILRLISEDYRQINVVGYYKLMLNREITIFISGFHIRFQGALELLLRTGNELWERTEKFETELMFLSL